jgi:DNA-binding response OmpR family regulator
MRQINLQKLYFSPHNFLLRIQHLLGKCRNLPKLISGIVKILIIEDEARIAMLVQQGLEEQGHQTAIAYDGNTGKKLAIQNDYDLVITDIILPQLNGIEVCKEIRSAKPGLPIIMLTALGTTNDKVEGFDAGADDYLVKPFDFRELLVRIRAVMNRRTGNLSFQSTILKYADLELNNQTKTVSRSGTSLT